MALEKSFISRLLFEAGSWAEKGIISAAQLRKIELLYLPGSAAVDVTSDRKTKTGFSITGVIVALASLCLAAGIVIFYAVNWKRMPPPVKLLQVFTLITGFYAAAGWFLFSEKRSRLIGRAFLLLGMVSFGAGIMLVAQIYHISAHPTNGLLVWAVGVFVLSVLMKERFGFYLSSVLFFIWNSWEFAAFDNPAYPYLVFVIAGIAAYWLLKDKIGLVASFCLILYYFYQTTIPDFRHNEQLEENLFNFALLNIPLSVVLYGAGHYLRRFEAARPAGILMNVAGMVIFVIPFAALSWPFTLENAGVIAALKSGDVLFPVLYIAFVAASFPCIVQRFREKKDILFLCSLAAFPLLALFLPMGNNIVRMVSMHTAIAGLVFALLYFCFTAKKKSGMDIALAFTFVFTMLIVKGIGFTVLAFTESSYTVAYLSGFIIFAVVCLLINALVAHLSAKQGKKYPSGILHALCSVLIWLTLYAASFEIPAQKSILSADKTVLIMLILFSAMAVVLIVLLTKVLREKKVIIWCAACVFAMTVVSLLSARPEMSWIFYSVMFNAMLIIVSAVYIYYSTVIQSKAMLNIMVCAFVLLIATRYFDLFWDMLSGSVLFMTTGILGLAGGYLLERKRRTLSRSMDDTRSSGKAAGASHE